MSDASDIERAGLALYGDRWHDGLMKALRMQSAKRIKAWDSGALKLPEGVKSEIIDLLRQRGQAAIQLADELEAAWRKE